MPPPTDHGNLGSLRYPFSAAHNRRTKAGWAREVTVRQFPIAQQIAGVNMRLDAGGIRELHWHKEAEWAFMLYGKARITAVDQEGRHFAADVREGDLWFFPAGIPHSIQGLDPDGCEFLLAFDDGAFSEDSTFRITDWFAHTPEVLAQNFGWPDTMSLAINGYLHVTANQLHRQARYQGGQDLRRKPYVLFRIRLDAAPVLLR